MYMKWSVITIITHQFYTQDWLLADSSWTFNGMRGKIISHFFWFWNCWCFWEHNLPSDRVLIIVTIRDLPHIIWNPKQICLYILFHTLAAPQSLCSAKCKSTRGPGWESLLYFGGGISHQGYKVSQLMLTYSLDMSRLLVSIFSLCIVPGLLPRKQKRQK